MFIIYDPVVFPFGNGFLFPFNCKWMFSKISVCLALKKHFLTEMEMYFKFYLVEYQGFVSILKYRKYITYLFLFFTAI